MILQTKTLESFPAFIQAAQALLRPSFSLTPTHYRLSAMPYELSFAFSFELAYAPGHSFIIRDADAELYGLVRLFLWRACPWHDIPTAFQLTKIRGKAIHLLPQGALCTLGKSVPYHTDFERCLPKSYNALSS